MFDCFLNTPKLIKTTEQRLLLSVWYLVSNCAQNHYSNQSVLFWVLNVFSPVSFFSEEDDAENENMNDDEKRQITYEVSQLLIYKV